MVPSTGGSGSDSPWPPRGVALTIRSASVVPTSSKDRTSKGVPTASATRRAGTARSGDRTTIVTDPTPIRPSARTQARAAPPAPVRQRPAPSRVDAQVFGEEALEPGRIGVVPDEVLALDDDGVDGPQELGVRGPLVDGVGDGLLVRHRDVRAGGAEGTEAGDRGGDLPGLDGHRHVHPVQTRRGERRVVDHGRQAAADRPADHAGHARGAADGGRGPAYSLHAARFASCSSRLRPNSWCPSSPHST